MSTTKDKEILVLQAEVKRLTRALAHANETIRGLSTSHTGVSYAQAFKVNEAMLIKPAETFQEFAIRYVDNYLEDHNYAFELSSHSDAKHS